MMCAVIRYYFGSKDIRGTKTVESVVKVRFRLRELEELDRTPISHNFRPTSRPHISTWGKTIDNYEFCRGLVSQSIANFLVPLQTYDTPLYMGVC